MTYSKQAHRSRMNPRKGPLLLGLRHISQPLCLRKRLPPHVRPRAFPCKIRAVFASISEARPGARPLTVRHGDEDTVGAERVRVIERLGELIWHIVLFVSVSCDNGISVPVVEFSKASWRDAELVTGIFAFEAPAL